MPTPLPFPAPVVAAAVAALATFAMSVVVAPSAAAVAPPPPAGSYQARPAPVLACGGLVGDCRVLLLEGSLDLAPAVPPSPGAQPVPRIEGSALVLRSLEGVGGPFPAAGDLPLTSLAGSDAGAFYLFTSPQGASQTVRLEIWPAGEESFLLRGTYDEGCCDRFRYEIGGVLFDFTGAGEEALRLLGGDFRVAVGWRDQGGGTGTGTPIAFDDRSGRFWFFRADNPELLVKVIDACDPFGRWWFFAAGLTDVEVEIRVDGPGGVRTYTRPGGEAFAPILDTDAFPCLEADAGGDSAPPPAI